MRPYVVVLAIGISSLGCARANYRAQARLSGSQFELFVELRQSHPFLAEYDRWLVLSAAGDSAQERVELFPDTGGHALVNLYRLGPTAFLVKTIGNHEYRIDAQSGSVTQTLTVTPESQALPAEAVFVGAFDFTDSRDWAFIPARDRPERAVGEIYLRQPAPNDGAQPTNGAPSSRAPNA